MDRGCGWRCAGTGERKTTERVSRRPGEGERERENDRGRGRGREGEGARECARETMRETETETETMLRKGERAHWRGRDLGGRGRTRGS